MAAWCGVPACPSPRVDPARVSGCQLVRLVSCALSLDLPMPTHHHTGQFGRLGDVQVAQGDFAGALKSFRDSLAIRERLATSDPGNALWQRDLAVSNERIGGTEQDLRHPDQARVSFERALAIYEALLRSNPENTYFLLSSTVPLMRLGDLDTNRRQAYFERALKILKDLDAAGRLEPARKGAIPWLENRLGRR
jgi:tetratricopeptide (TPR) repeat protein